MDISEEIQKIVDQLKLRSTEDVEKTFQYWQTSLLGPANYSGAENIENFYNDKIRISLGGEQCSSEISGAKFEKFSDLFREDNGNGKKRLFITGPAGYGKSVFVHELLRRWAGVTTKIQNEKFLFVFLFRLSEIQFDDEPLESLMSKYFDPATVDSVLKLLENESLLGRTLFVFDGLHETNLKLSKNLHYLMYACSTPYVVITKRSDENGGAENESSANYANFNNLALNGFTDQGANDQLEKFSIEIVEIPTDLYFKNLMKIPLFNALYSIVRSRDYAFGNDSTPINRCDIVDRYVHCLLDRYRRRPSNDYQGTCESELFSALGRAAQCQFNMISFKRRNPEVWPDFDGELSQLYSVAKAIGLINVNSTSTKLTFPHKTFADYFAAYYWSKNLDPNQPIQKISNCKVYFSPPIDGTCFSRCWFSYFLSRFSRSYKNALWALWFTEPPLLVEYESLPIKKLAEPRLTFTREIDCREVDCILNKLEFDNFDVEKYPLELSLVGFEPLASYARLKTLQRLKLFRCSIRMSPGAFFSTYNLTELQATCCSWEYDDDADDGGNNIRRLNDPKLTKLSIYNHEGRVTRFLTEILDACANLKELILDTLNDFDWLNALPGDRKSLRRLILISSTLSDQSVNTLIDVLPRSTLKSLEFSDVKGIDRIGLLKVMNSSVRLQNVRIDNKCDIDFTIAKNLLTNFRCIGSSWQLNFERI